MTYRWTSFPSAGGKLSRLNTFERNISVAQRKTKRILETLERRLRVFIRWKPYAYPLNFLNLRASSIFPCNIYQFPYSNDGNAENSSWFEGSWMGKYSSVFVAPSMFFIHHDPSSRDSCKICSHHTLFILDSYRSRALVSKGTSTLLDDPYQRLKAWESRVILESGRRKESFNTIKTKRGYSWMPTCFFILFLPTRVSMNGNWIRNCKNTLTLQLSQMKGDRSNVVNARDTTAFLIRSTSSRSRDRVVQRFTSSISQSVFVDNYRSMDGATRTIYFVRVIDALGRKKSAESDNAVREKLQLFEK